MKNYYLTCVLIFYIIIIDVYSFIVRNDYWLDPNKQLRMISINKSQLNAFGTVNDSLLKIQVEIDYCDTNGLFIQSSWKTANILVKFWKNFDNTPASQVLNYTYDQISKKTYFNSGYDPNDDGILDIDSLYNYETNHKFLYNYSSFNINSNDSLFILGVYRYANTNISSLFQMSNLSSMIKIIVTINYANKNQESCPLCYITDFCPLKNCQCYGKNYTDCQILKGQLLPFLDSGKFITTSNFSKQGDRKYYEIFASSPAYNDIKIDIKINFKNDSIDLSRLFVIVRIENNSENGNGISNIFNFDQILSPVLKNPILSKQIISVSSQNTQKMITSYPFVTVSQSININSSQMIALSIYYLESFGVTSQLSYSIDVKATTILNSIQVINIWFVLGMVAIGFIILILIVCLCQCFARNSSRPFTLRNLLGILSTSRSHSNSSRIVNTNYINEKYKYRILEVPKIEFSFLSRLVFRPINFLASQKSIILSKVNIQKNIQSNQICSICLQQFQQDSIVKLLYCGHVVDILCLQTWFHKQLSCPLCRQSFQPHNVYLYQEKIRISIVENDTYQTLIQDEVIQLQKGFKAQKKYKNKQKGQQFYRTEETLVRYPNESHKNQLDQIQLTQNKSKLNKLQQISNLTSLIKSKTSLQKQQFQTDNKYKNDQSDIYYHNYNMSVEYLLQIYKFYRSIYLYHQNQKKTDKNLITINQSQMQLLNQTCISIHDRINTKSTGIDAIINQNNMIIMQDESAQKQQTNQCNLTIQSNHLNYQDQYNKNSLKIQQKPTRQQNKISKNRLNNKILISKRKFQRKLNFQTDQFVIISKRTQYIQNQNQYQINNINIVAQTPIIFDETKSTKTNDLKQTKQIKLKSLSLRQEMDQLQKGLDDFQQHPKQLKNNSHHMVFIQMDSDQQDDKQQIKYKSTKQNIVKRKNTTQPSGYIDKYTSSHMKLEIEQKLKTKPIVMSTYLPKTGKINIKKERPLKNKKYPS